MQTTSDISIHNVTSFMYEIMNHEKYEPTRQRPATRDGKEPARIHEIIEEVEELEITGKDKHTEKTKGKMIVCGL